VAFGNAKSFGANTVGQADVYPASRGGTHAANTGNAALQAVGATNESAAAMPATPGRPIHWLVVIILLVFALRFVAPALGEREDYKSIRVSVYNIILITISAVVGLTVFKVFAAKVRIPGLSPLLLAA
jgi:lipopolysaccharide export LptBFGC system permease protein LptF